MADMQTTAHAQGKIVQCIGAVVDVEFPRDAMPKIYDALKMEGSAADPRSAAAARRRRGAHHRAGLLRRPASRHGDQQHRQGHHGAGRPGHARPHHGRARQPDRRARPGRPHAGRRYPSQGRRRTTSSRLRTDLLETGIKVIDLVCPFAKGGKVGLFGGAGVGKTVNMMELINNIAKAHSRPVGVRRRRRAHPRGQRLLSRDGRLRVS